MTFYYTAQKLPLYLRDALAHNFVCKRSEEQAHFYFSRVEGKMFLKLYKHQNCSDNKHHRSSSRFFLPFGNVLPHTLKFVATGLVTCSERQIHELFNNGNISSRKAQIKTLACSSSSFFF